MPLGCFQVWKVQNESTVSADNLKTSTSSVPLLKQYAAIVYYCNLTYKQGWELILKKAKK